MKLWRRSIGRRLMLFQWFVEHCGADGSKKACWREGSGLLCYSATYAARSHAVTLRWTASSSRAALDTNPLTTRRRFWCRQRANWWPPSLWVCELATLSTTNRTFWQLQWITIRWDYFLIAANQNKCIAIAIAASAFTSPLILSPFSVKYVANFICLFI